jgi:putative coA-substrate-specific enzyme activase
MMSKSPVNISSTCTVFAESEVISHLSAGVNKEDIIAGIHISVAGRVAALAKRVGIKDKVVMVGGVAKNIGVVKAMEDALGKNIEVPKLAQLTGALGAALFAFEALNK